MDVARMLAKSADDLARTDAPAHALKAFARSGVTDITLVGHRSAADAKWTTKELRELGEPANADVVVDPLDLELDEAAQARYDVDPAVRRNVDILREWSTRPRRTRARRVHIRFFMRPLGILGDGAARAVRFDRSRPGRGQDQVDLQAELVVRAVGYRGLGLPGVPFDSAAGTIPNTGGRVLRDGLPSYGEYTAGWIKRGPTGVIGTNRHDALETVGTLLDDVKAGDVVPGSSARVATDLCALLRQRGVEVVEWEGWLAVEQAEIELGSRHGRPAVKLSDRQLMLAAARGAERADSDAGDAASSSGDKAGDQIP